MLRKNAHTVGKSITTQLHKSIPRQMFDIAIQARPALQYYDFGLISKLLPRLE